MKTIQIVFAMLIACAICQPVLAQSNKSDRSKDTSASFKMVSYLCPMHPEVTSDNPGKCAKCGMTLSLSKKELMKADVMKFSCPMHPEITSDSPGKCTKCGMNMNLSKKEEMRLGTINGYTCSMHPEVASDKPGKCPKCGMALTAVKPKKN